MTLKEKLDKLGCVYVRAASAARMLGLAPSTLHRKMSEHRIFEPAARGFATGVGHRMLQYHAEQLLLIESVMLGDMTADEAWERWAPIRARLGYGLRDLAPAAERAAS